MWTPIVVCVLSLCALTQAAVPVVPAPWGTVQGVTLEGRKGRKMNAYLGIPYALPPTGPLRFQRPQPHPGPGEGKEFIADTDPVACPQDRMLIGQSAKTDEDCLTLNVYTPISEATSPRPVMFWIHGGGLEYGDAPSYKPFKLVADGDVIVVSIQYRLAALGFLSTGDDTLPGNMGLWDQNLALKWVKDNIGAFGGDPGRVTVFGESAGSWSTGLQIVSPYSKGLFHRAVMQSGSPQSAVYVAPEEREAFEAVSAKLGCEDKDDVKVIECWRTKTADEILNKTAEYSSKTGNWAPFNARIDGDFIPRDPVDLAADEQYVQENGLGDIDIIIGFNNKEGAMVAGINEIEGSPVDGYSDEKLFQSFVDWSVKLHNKKKSNQLLKKVVNFFYRQADFGSDAVQTEAIVDMYSDSVFFAPAFQWFRPMAAQPHKGRRYMYMFEHDFAFNENRIRGSHHGDELFVEFDISVPEDSMFVAMNKTTQLCSEEDHQLGDLFVKTITSFAATGNPSLALKEKLGGDWPEFTAEDEAVLSFKLSPRVLRDVLKDRIALWAKLIPEVIASEKQKQETASQSQSGKDEL